MIIIGNSHVSMFRQGRILSRESDTPLEIKWVGAITAAYFFANHPAAQKIRSLLSQIEDWKFLSIGMHDNLLLCRALANNQYPETLGALLEQYKAIFSELNASGKFGWLVAPQQLKGLEHLRIGEKDIFRCSQEFNIHLSTWCLANGIVVINPLDKILDQNGHPKAELLQVDGIHLNSTVIKYYLEEIAHQTGQELAYVPPPQSIENALEPKTEAESLALLVAAELGLPWDQTRFPHGTRRQFEDKLIVFISERLVERGLNPSLQRDEDFVDSGGIDSLELVETYTYAAELFGCEIDFDVDLRELNTVENLSAFFFKNKPLTQNDFLATLTPDTSDEIRTAETLFAEARIAGMPAEMVVHLQEIIHLQSGGRRYYYGIIPYWLALIEANRGNYALALKLLDQAEDGRLACPFRSSRIEHYRTRWEETLSRLQAKILGSPIPGSILVKTSNGLNQAIDSKISEVIAALYQHGEDLLQQGKLDEAIFAFIKTIGASPFHSMAAYKLGMAYWRQNKPDQAAKYFKRALAFDVSNKTIVSSYADFLLSAQHPEQAKEVYKRYLHHNPGDAEIMKLLSSLDVASNGPDEILVSAIVSTYNSERFMRGCLEDLEAQTIAHRLEIIVVDSNSPQNERAIVEEFQQRYDNIVYLRTEEREGVYAAWNRGIKLARGKYITNANTDDRHRLDAFERLVAVLDSRPDIALTYANVWITETENETFNRHTRSGAYRWKEFDPLTLIYGCYMGPQPMWRRSLHQKYGYFDESFKSAGDWEFWLRMAATEQFLHVDQFLGLYLKSPTSVEHRDRDLSVREARRVHRRYRHRVPQLQAGRGQSSPTSSDSQEGTARETTQVPPTGSAELATTLVLVGGGSGQSEKQARCLEYLQRFRPLSEDLAVQAVNLGPSISANGLNLVQAPEAGPAAALGAALAAGANYVVLLSADVIVTGRWLDNLLVVAGSDPAIAAVGPTANAAPSPQRVKRGYRSLKKELQKFADRRARKGRDAWEEVSYLGGFCLLLKGEAVQQIGGLDGRLPLPEALWDLYNRLRAGGFKLACAQGVYVHHDELTAGEGAGFDSWARAAETLPDTLAQIEEAQAHGDWPQAVELLRKTLDIPAATNVVDGTTRWNSLGFCYFQAGQLPEAENAFQKGLALSPNHLDLLSNLADLYLGQGQLDRATEYLNRALAVNPDDLNVLLSLGNCSVQLGATDTALLAFRRILTLAPETEGVGEIVGQLEALGATEAGAIVEEK